MENNKFNKFYSKKPLTELIEKLRDHRIHGDRMDKEWFEALKVHLSEREISSDERQTVNYLLSDDFDPINELGAMNNQQIEIAKGQKTQDHSNLAINPSNIISAGRNIKGVVYLILVMTLCAIIAIVITNITRNLDTIKNAYLFLGAAIIICNLIILFQLHSMGENLVNSVYEKQNE